MFWFVLYLIDQVLEIARVHFGFAEADEGALGDALGHRGLADDEDVFGHHLVPYPLLVLYARYGEERGGHSGAVDAVGHIERI